MLTNLIQRCHQKAQPKQQPHHSNNNQIKEITRVDKSIDLGENEDAFKVIFGSYIHIKGGKIGILSNLAINSS